MSIRSNELKMAENKRDELNKEFRDMLNSLSSLYFIMGETDDAKELAIYKIQFDDLFAEKDILSTKLSLAEREVYKIRAKKAPLQERNLTEELKDAEVQCDKLKRKFSDIMDSLSSLDFIRKEMAGTEEEHNCKLQYHVLFAQKDDLGNSLTLAERLVYKIREEIRAIGRASGRKCN